jgi:hypothetical protein
LEVALGDEAAVHEFMEEMNIQDQNEEILFDILIQAIVRISENNFEISYSVLTLAVFFYFTIV